MKKNTKNIDQENGKEIKKISKKVSQIKNIENYIESINGMSIKDVPAEILKSSYMHETEESARAELKSPEVFRFLRTVAKHIGNTLKS